MAEEKKSESKQLKEKLFASKKHGALRMSEDDQTACEALCKDYMAFLNQSKTEREACANAEALLKEHGFVPFTPGMALKAGDKVYQNNRGKAMIAAIIGSAPITEGVRLCAAHIDSPRLDMKQNPLYEDSELGLFKTHYYGGIRKYQWLARPLALHGVIIKEDGTSIKVVLGEDPGDPVFTIADLLPHLAQKEVTKTVADAFDAEKLNVILGHSPLPSASDTDETAKEQKDPVRANILALLNRKYGIREEDLMSAELQAVPAGPARYVGLDAALIGGYGQDDRVCVFTALSAFLDAQAPEHANCLIFWDKEEIGSEGSTGAQGRFLEYCMEDLTEAWEPGTKVRDVFQNSTAVSGDVHAATDPDWQELHEKLNASIIGHGPTFCKFTGSRGKYGANDAHPEYIGWLRGVLNRKNIPWQMAELGKVDHGGGGTVALYLAAYGMDTIDLGPAVLSMHSPFELLSKADLYSTKLAYQAILEA